MQAQLAGKQAEQAAPAANPPAASAGNPPPATANSTPPARDQPAGGRPPSSGGSTAQHGCAAAGGCGSATRAACTDTRAARDASPCDEARRIQGSFGTVVLRHARALLVGDRAPDRGACRLSRLACRRSRRQSDLDDLAWPAGGSRRSPSPYTRLEPSTGDAASMRPNLQSRTTPSWSRSRARTSGRDSPAGRHPRRPRPSTSHVRRDHQQRNRDQSRPGRSAGRSRFPHGLRSVRPGRRSRCASPSAASPIAAT